MVTWAWKEVLLKMQVPRPRLRPDLIQVLPPAAAGVPTVEKHWGGPVWEASTSLGWLQTR